MSDSKEFKERVRRWNPRVCLSADAQGITLMDHFAAHAMQALIARAASFSGKPLDVRAPDELCEQAYSIAMEMLSARTATGWEDFE